MTIASLDPFVVIIHVQYIAALLFSEFLDYIILDLKYY